MTREEAIDGVKKLKNYLCAGNPLWDTTTISEVLDMAIFALESQECKTGMWIENQNGTYRCNQCGCKHGRSNFCPNCGVPMSAQTDSE